MYLAQSTNWGHFPDRIGTLEVLEVLVFEERGKPEYPEKTSRSKDENQQQTHPTYDAESGNRTRATLVGGLRGRQILSHCAIPAPPMCPNLLQKFQLFCSRLFSLTEGRLRDATISHISINLPAKI